MSTPTVAKPPDAGKPEPHPILVMLRTLEASYADQDRLAAETILKACRTLEGRG